MIVDDDPDHTVIARIVVHRVAPHALVSVLKDPRTALSELSGAPYGALVLMDRMLDGLAVIARLSALCTRRPDLRVALLSSSLDEMTQLRALAAGAVIAAEKPLTLAAWCLLVADLLDRSFQPERAAA